MVRNISIQSIKIDTAVVESILKVMVADEVEDQAQNIMEAIKDLYKDSEGNDFEWKTVSYPNARTGRMYTAIICDNPQLRYHEAKHGLIAAKLRSLSHIVDPIALARAAGGGSIISL